MSNMIAIMRVVTGLNLKFRNLAIIQGSCILLVATGD
jgi:hypothetical protein